MQWEEKHYTSKITHSGHSPAPRGHSRGPLKPVVCASSHCEAQPFTMEDASHDALQHPSICLSPPKPSLKDRTAASQHLCQGHRQDPALIRQPQSAVSQVSCAWPPFSCLASAQRPLCILALGPLPLGTRIQDAQVLCIEWNLHTSYMFSNTEPPASEQVAVTLLPCWRKNDQEKVCVQYRCRLFFKSGGRACG